ncbi:MAG TPA: HAMP domain-containing sensor histidine kinase [Chthonomonadaceae bacterium]|nr:HAMP domain-containing sensor histidine kinase [Chthonomonadaceae bacterium]
MPTSAKRWEQSLHNQATAILSAWQAEARTQWPQHRSLIAQKGAAYVCADATLAVLDAVCQAEETSEQPLPSQRTPVGAETHGLTLLSEDLRLKACVSAWNALPLSWEDLKNLCRLLEDQVGVSLQRAGADAALRWRVTAALNRLVSAIADRRVPQLERELATDREQALITQHLAGRFLANASHELRTPLTAILGFAELLLEETYGELNSEQCTAIGHINDSAQNLLEIVNNLLDLLHYRAGKLKMDYRSVEVKPVLQNLYDLLSSLAERKKVRFSLTISNELGRIDMDENIVRHIVYHLLSSALRSTPEGGEVMLIAHREPERLSIQTHDTALHLPPEALANMTNPFPLLENSPARGYEGWEVGLPLVRRYVDLHGGTLETESLPEQGTIFRIFLPTRRPPD